jgi:putative transposase
MKKTNQEDPVRQLHLALSSQDIQAMFMARAKNALTALAVELMEQDVARLCGHPFARKAGGLCHRGGSEMTSVLVDGGQVAVRRPRARNTKGEVPLPVMNKLRDRDLCDAQMLSRVALGVTTRNYQGIVDDFSMKTGISKSSVSRAFKRASQKDLDALNHAKLSEHRFAAILIDGTGFGDRTVIVAVGITTDAQKIPLGIREGDTENASVVKDLLTSLKDRGFQFAADRLLAVTDGGKALRSALKSLWGDAVIVQRCWIHKLRNIRDYLPKENHGELYGRMKKLMGLTSHSAALQELARMTTWLASISDEASASLQEAGRELLTVHELGLTGDFRRALSSTNLIESLIGVIKNKTGRVKNWGYHPKLKAKIPRDKILRWVASSIQSHRPKLRKLRGAEQSKKLIAALNLVAHQKLSA